MRAGLVALLLSASCGKVEDDRPNADADADADGDFDVCTADFSDIDCAEATGSYSCFSAASCVGGSVDAEDFADCLLGADGASCTSAHDLAACGCGACPEVCDDLLGEECRACLCASCTTLFTGCVGPCD